MSFNSTRVKLEVYESICWFLFDFFLAKNINEGNDFEWKNLNNWYICFFLLCSYKNGCFCWDILLQYRLVSRLWLMTQVFRYQQMSLLMTSWTILNFNWLVRFWKSLLVLFKLKECNHVCIIWDPFNLIRQYAALSLPDFKKP